MLETERLVLRKPRREDADDLVAVLGDPEVARWTGGATCDLAATQARIESWLARWDRDGISHFAVVVGNRVIGRCGFLVWDTRRWSVSSYAEAEQHGETELGWSIAREHWGHGYATEAADALRGWAYRERGVERLISLIDPRNTRSIRVAEKLGAEPEASIAIAGEPAVVWVHPR